MLRSAVLEAIAHGVAAGGDDLAIEQELAGIDPLLRALARRGVRLALEDALLLGGNRPPADLFRLAWIVAARRIGELGGKDDPAAVAAAYARLSAPARPHRRFWWATLAALIAVLAGGALGTRALARAMRPRVRPDASRRVGPPARGAFATGGYPGYQPTVEIALIQAVPAYLIALDRWGEARRAGAPEAELDRLDRRVVEARAGAIPPEAAHALGQGAYVKLGEVLDRARAVHEAPDAESADQAATRYLEAVGAADDELAAAALGYFVDGDVITDTSGRRMVILYSYAVLDVSLWKGAGRPVRALRIDRLDNLNMAPSLVGFTRPELRDALVLVNEADDVLATVILPALAPGAGVRLCDEDAEAAGSTWQGVIKARAGEVVREEYGSLRFDHDAATRLGIALAERHDLLERWKARLETRGLLVADPKGFVINHEWEDAFDGYVPADELDHLRELDDEIVGPDSGEVRTQVREAFVVSVERHEVAHRVDYSRDEELRMPAALERYTGPAHDAGPQPRDRPAAQRARDELSAYLGELARDERTPRSNLSLVARFAFDHGHWGTAECYVSLVILEGLAGELGIPTPEPFVRNGWIDRAHLAEVYVALTRVPAADLRAAAKRLWEKLYDAPLPEIVRVSEDH